MILLFGVTSAHAQVATLLADRIEANGDQALSASGNVEVLFEETRLTASAILYNSNDGSLIIEGPISLSDGTDTVFLADAAELSGDLREGILRGARMVLDQQLQIAAAEIARVDGRYTQLYKTVASSCQVCAKRPVPLWQIRAEKIIHDQQERQLYFEKAQLRVAGVPVFYIPRLRMPDPTRKRATGFLLPTIRNSSQLGSGIKVPYFVTIGDHADVTLTPYVSNKTRTLEVQFRRAFHNGDIELSFAASDDSLRSGPRYYVLGDGNFRLRNGYRLRFDIEATSDPSYLLDYGYSGKDRLDSAVSLTRTRTDQNFRADLVGFNTLRGSELPIDDQLPNVQGEILHQQRFFPSIIGGQGLWTLGVQAHARESGLDQIGRDVARIGGTLDWGTSKVFGNGMIAHIGAGAVAEAYFIQQDSSYPQQASYFLPTLQADLRWPLARTSANGARSVLEPIIQVAWSDAAGKNVPNEDSTLVEFDEGNLIAASRFPGEDRNETGLRGAAALKWAHFDPSGWNMDIMLGRAVRETDTGDFSPTSGLDGTRSDWLIAGSFRVNKKLSLMTRGLVDDDLNLTKSDTRVSWQADRLGLASTYSWIEADPVENRPHDTSQLTLDGRYRFGRNWFSSFDVRYDFEAQKATRAGLGLEYRNECISLDLSFSRRFTSATGVTPNTDFNLAVSLLGFGSGQRGQPSGCQG